MSNLKDENTGKHQPFEYDPSNQGLFERSRVNTRPIEYERSETSKWRALTAPFCRGIGVDIGAAGDPVVPNAICVDLPQGYCPPFGPVPTHVPIDARKLGDIFAEWSLDYVYSSHLLEDFGPGEWELMVHLWGDLVKPGGYLILVVPEVDLWRRAVEAGQPPNLNHKHEFEFKELTNFFSKKKGWHIVCEMIPDEKDYSIIFAARRRLAP